MSIAAILGLAKGAAASWREILIGLLLLGVFWFRGQYHDCKAGRLADKAAQQAAVLEAQQKAEALSNELVIAQAAALVVTDKKVVEYVDRIRTVQVPDTACAADPRMRIGNHGVRDLVRGGGSPAVGGPPAAVPRPGPGARP